VLDTAGVLGAQVLGKFRLRCNKGALYIPLPLPKSCEQRGRSAVVCANYVAPTAQPG